MTTTRRLNGAQRWSAAEASSGNVFADLGFARPDIALAKAELASQIEQIIRERRLKQAQVAEILGVDQGKVSALVRGRLSGFSTDRLIRFLVALGRHIEIVVRKQHRSDKRKHVSVVSSA